MKKKKEHANELLRATTMYFIEVGSRSEIHYQFVLDFTMVMCIGSHKIDLSETKKLERSEVTGYY